MISKFKRTFLTQIGPLILFFLTICTTVGAGFFLTGKEWTFPESILEGLPYAMAVLFVVGTHAAGHNLSARLHGVKASLPYFIPRPGISGTFGAYTKMHWPIVDRLALIRIFAIGPIAGFCASWITLIIGLLLSNVQDVTMMGSSIKLGDSLITYMTSLAIFGKLPSSKDIVLHPIALAGWMGIDYNMWHLLPIGRLDGGRLVYGLWGFRATRLVSYIVIGTLMLFGIIWRGWIWTAIFGFFCLYRFREQYPSDKYELPLNKSMIILSLISAIIFIISFPPVPFSMTIKD